MRINPGRGLKYGLGNGLIAAIAYFLNAAIRSEPVEPMSVLTFALLAIVFFGLIWTFTDKIGSDIGG